MIKITLDARMLFMAGIGRYIREILSELIKHDNIKLTCLYPLSEQDSIKNLSFYNACAWIPMRTKIFSFSEQIELFFKTPKSDIFWSPQYNVPIILPFRVKRRVVTIHDVFQLHDFKSLSLIKKIYVALMFNYSVLKSQSIITGSQFSKQEIKHYTYFAENKVVCISYGINSDFNQSIKTQPVMHPFILMVGNVKPHKNLRAAIQAFLKIEGLISHELVIVGKKDGFLTGDVQSLGMTEGRKRIRFTGIVGDQELKQLYANASLFLFPSLYEGFGLPVLEAMSFSLPIIVSDIPVFKELFGTSVTYFNPISIDDIADCIVGQLQGIQKKPNYSEILKKYQWSEAAKKHEIVFRSILN
jgi:glycosyltransferase involved in cell wall biosynthesis